MASLAKCIEFHNRESKVKFSESEIAELERAAEAYRKEGYGASEASKNAVNDAVKEMGIEHKSILSQVEKQIGKPKAPEGGRSVTEVAKDINALMGDRGSLGATKLNPVQQAALERLKADMDNLKVEAAKAGKELGQYLRSRGYQPDVVDALVRMDQPKAAPERQPVPEAAQAAPAEAAAPAQPAPRLTPVRQGALDRLKGELETVKAQAAAEGKELGDYLRSKGYHPEVVDALMASEGRTAPGTAPARTGAVQQADLVTASKADEAAKRIWDRFAILKKKSPETYTEAIIYNSYKDSAKQKFNELVDSFEPLRKEAVNNTITSRKALTTARNNSPSWKKVHEMEGGTGGGFFQYIKDIYNYKGAAEMLMDDYIKAHRALTRANPNRTTTVPATPGRRETRRMVIVPGKDGKPATRRMVTIPGKPGKPATVKPNPLKNPNNVTYADAQVAIQQIEAKYVELGGTVEGIRSSLEGFKNWTDKFILQEGLESGFLSKERYDAIKKNNEFYATFDVLDHIPEDLANLPTMASGEWFSAKNQDVFKAMKGTEKKIANPTEATIKKFINAQAKYAQNKVASTLIDSSDIKGLLRPVAENPKQFAIMKNQGLDPVLKGQWAKKEFDTVSRFKNGRPETYLVEKSVADAMKQLTPAQANKLVHAFNSVFRRTATTAYLPFTISNVFRDALMAYTTAPVYGKGDIPKFMADWSVGFWEGLKSEFGKSAATESYLRHGGGHGWVGQIRADRIGDLSLYKKNVYQKGMTVITSPIELIERVSSAAELSSRLAVNRRALMQGLDAKTAAVLGKRSTIDFNAGGTYTKAINQYVPFLNARVQGRVTVARAAVANPGLFGAKAFTSVVMPATTFYVLNQLYFSDLYADIPEPTRQNYFTLIIGSEKDRYGKKTPKYIAIPKGDIGQMVWNPIEFGLDQALKKDRQSFVKFALNYLNDLSPVEFTREGELSMSKMASSVTPPFIKAPLEAATNTNLYYGTEIDPHYMRENKPPELRYREDTPELYRHLGKILKVSPNHIQNFASNVFAGYGREGLSPSAMLRGLTGRLVKTRGGEVRNRGFEALDDIKTGYISARAYALEMSKAGDRASALKLMREWNNGLEKQIKAFNKEFGKKGYPDQGGIKKSYYFTPEKMKNVLRRIDEDRDPLEKRLRRK